MAETDPVREVVRVAGRLVSLMNRETELLQTHQLAAIGALQEEKSGLALTYAVLVRQIRGQPELFAALTRAVRDELRDSFKRFEEVARANARAIEAARQANERVIHAIIEAATLARGNTGTGYSQSGARPVPRRPDNAAPLSVAFNQQL
jgi:hypothetical protein